MEQRPNKRLRLLLLLVALGLLAVAAALLGRRDPRHPRRMTGEYRGVYAGNCIARLLLDADGTAEYRDGCDGALELRAHGTWSRQGGTVRFAWRDEPADWTRQKDLGRVSGGRDAPLVIELDFVRLEQLPSVRRLLAPPKDRKPPAPRGKQRNGRRAAG